MAVPLDSVEAMARVVKVTSAYVAHNPVKPDDIPKLIAAVHRALVGIDTEQLEGLEAPVPAVPINKSVTPDFIVCLDDGKKFKSMKRHLRGLGMTPDEYRAKWGLPDSYPMVALAYSSARKQIAKVIGLGRKPRKTSPGR